MDISYDSVSELEEKDAELENEINWKRQIQAKTLQPTVNTLEQLTQPAEAQSTMLYMASARIEQIQSSFSQTDSPVRTESIILLLDEAGL